ncbi:hypothetical protein O181_030282 [Austropuccinia psidii MF-1]|uniref:RING-type E3 ubiquitin transferase n=1 Tax=Austropuccinia psidii MF-1 TaxID=1389203 RepID=A0A9Q3CVG0_9BASI|nr:hypothetical protein [Austropuccinia psidii MF-1]
MSEEGHANSVDQLNHDENQMIRNKRLAKLQQQSTPPISSSNQTKNPSPPSKSNLNSVNSLKSLPNSQKQDAHEIKNLKQNQNQTLLTSSNAFNFQDLAQWQHNLISKIFQVTLQEPIHNPLNSNLIYLVELKNELEEDQPGSSNLISIDMADRLLIARLSLDSNEINQTATLPNETLFDYLSKCWIRTLEERSQALASKFLSKEKLEMIDKVRQLIVSYLGLIIQDPNMFPTSSGSITATDQLVKLLINPDPSDSLTTHLSTLIYELAQRFDNDGLEDIIGPILVKIAMDMNLQTSTWHLGGHQWRSLVRAIEDLIQVKPIARLIPTLPSWMPITEANDKGRRIEFLWLFGPMLSLSTFPDRVPSLATEYFENPKERPRSDLESATKGLQSALNSLQLSLFNVFDRIVRSGPLPRESVLEFWAKIIQFNSKRAAIQVDRASVASDGIIVNTQAVLLQFAAPFLDPQFSKIDKVDPFYFKRSNRLNIREETKINATKEESDQFFESMDSAHTAGVNFISEIFFLNVAIFRLGILAVSKNWDKKAREIDDMKKELERAEADRRWDGTPHEAARKASLTKFKNQIHSLEAKLVAYEVQMCDPEFLSKCNNFCSFVMTWCVRMVDPFQQHPRVPVKLPLPDKCPLEFRMLPEYVLEDVIEFYSFVSRHAPGILLQSTLIIDEILTFTLVFLTTPYLKNYHLKSKFIEILYFNTLPIPGRPNGILGDSLNYHPLSLAHLMSALMQIYIEVEITGSHTQFYDKFYSRRYIALILRKVWHNQTHRTALKKISLTESFIRFANLLMNDVTFLLDDSLGQLQEVHRIETKMADHEAWSKLPESERKEEESKLISCERHCPSFLSLANENVNMLKIFTEETPSAFLKAEIVGRLAAMLNYNLNILAGPKCQTLKVKDPKKFNFQPKILLSDLLQVYLNLWNQSSFHEAICNDGRSYTRELFERAERIARKANLKSTEELNNLIKLVEQVEELKQSGVEEEEELGEIPDEFLDPLMATLMKDPVILPTSKTTIDLSTIKQHFLSDATDPFNRMPLKIEDVIPDVELKSRIADWVKEKKSSKMEI